MIYCHRLRVRIVIKSSINHKLINSSMTLTSSFLMAWLVRSWYLLKKCCRLHLKLWKQANIKIIVFLKLPLSRMKLKHAKFNLKRSHLKRALIMKLKRKMTKTIHYKLSKRKNGSSKIRSTHKLSGLPGELLKTISSEMSSIWKVMTQETPNLFSKENTKKRNIEIMWEALAV